MVLDGIPDCPNCGVALGLQPLDVDRPDAVLGHCDARGSLFHVRGDDGHRPTPWRIVAPAGHLCVA